MDNSNDVNKGNVMGYPSMNPNYPPPQHIQQGYAMPTYQAGYVPPYQGYAFPPSSKHLASPSFNRLYGAQAGYGPWLPDSQMKDNNVNKFSRLMLITMTSLIMTMCMVSLVIWFLFGTEIPEFHLKSFSVSNLNISSSMIEASWDVNMTVLNRNPNFRVNAGPVQVSIVYNNFPLVMSAVEPFSLLGHQQFDLNIKLENQKSVCKEVLATQMKEDENSGAIPFSVRFVLGADLYSSNVQRRETFKVFCEDLKINFASNGNGALALNSLNLCQIYS